MADDSAARRSWWLSRVLLPVALAAGAAVALAVTDLDARTLEPIYDRQQATFGLRRHWLTNGVLHLGGKWCVLLAALTLLVLALAGGRRPALRPWRGRFLYLVACVGLTALVAALWKDLALQSTPWNTTRFGGQQPWPGDGTARSLAAWIGSPGAHAASGFAWTGLYFVAAASGVRRRARWLAPGLALGLSFALTQHLRGAHQPSHQLWSAALAWSIAALLALLFRRAGWMHWDELSATAPSRW